MDLEVELPIFPRTHSHVLLGRVQTAQGGSTLEIFETDSPHFRVRWLGGDDLAAPDVTVETIRTLTRQVSLSPREYYHR